MDIDANDLISGLKSQRNTAWDEAATVYALLKAVERERDALKARVAQLECPVTLD